MIRTALFPAFAALAFLGACATATPYQAATESSRGYDNQRIESDRWQVSFAGNSLTDRETVETYLLYRAAELTQQEGFDHFRVVRRETDEDSRLVSTGFSSTYSPFYSGFYCDYRFFGPRGVAFRRSGLRSSRFNHFHDPFGYGFGAPDYREIVRYEATAEIIMGRGSKPESDPAFFDAGEVLQNLSTQIVRPEVDA
ncbi:MAG: hypothetical protein AAFQ22_15440 [Pseudomonadota bacterium]